MEHIQIDDKIRLETIKLSMALEIFEAINRDRENLKTWLPFVESTKQVSDTKQFINSIVNQVTPKKEEIYSIWFKEEFAGLIGFKGTDWMNRKSEFGYWLISKMQGKGIMTKCVEKLIRYSFQKLKFQRIQIKVAHGNTKSEAIPKGLGFTFEGVERDGEYHQQKYLSLNVYSLLRTDNWI